MTSDCSPSVRNRHLPSNSVSDMKPKSAHQMPDQTGYGPAYGSLAWRSVGSVLMVLSSPLCRDIRPDKNRCFGALDNGQGHPARRCSADHGTRQCSASHRIDFCRAGRLRQLTRSSDHDNRHRFRKCRPRQSGARQEQTRLDCGGRGLAFAVCSLGGGSGVAMGRSAVHSTVTWLGRLRPAVM